MKSRSAICLSALILLTLVSVDHAQAGSGKDCVKDWMPFCQKVCFNRDDFEKCVEEIVDCMFDFCPPDLEVPVPPSRPPGPPMECTEGTELIEGICVVGKIEEPSGCPSDTRLRVVDERCIPEDYRILVSERIGGGYYVVCPPGSRAGADECEPLSGREETGCERGWGRDPGGKCAPLGSIMSYGNLFGWRALRRLLSYRSGEALEEPFTRDFLRTTFNVLYTENLDSTLARSREQLRIEPR